MSEEDFETPWRAYQDQLAAAQSRYHVNARLYEAMESLNGDQLFVLYVLYWGDNVYEAELAEVMGVPRNRVKTIKETALKKLARIIDLSNDDVLASAFMAQVAA